MKYLIALYISILFVSCSSDLKTNESNVYWSREQLLDTMGLKLYPFIPFTDEEWRDSSYTYKLEQRQIPKDFLNKMTAKDLFYQIVYTDLSKSMLLFNTFQQGFENAKQLNMVPELLNRHDSGHVLLDLLEKTTPSTIEGEDGFWWFDCLQILLAQPEIIKSMTDKDIDNCIVQQLRCHDEIRDLSKNNKNWEYPQSVSVILYGLGNIMIQHNFKPFTQTLARNPITNEVVWDTQLLTEQSALQVIDYIKQLKNR